MTKIENFIDKLHQDANSVNSLLREAKSIASDLNQEEIKIWIDRELNGYGDTLEKDYPEYRILRGQMKGWNPYYGWQPVVHSSQEMEDMLCARGASQSISEIESLVSSSEDTFKMPYSTEIANQILKNNFPTELIMEISKSALVGILSTVRNKLLDWANELKKNGIVGEEMKFTSQEKNKAENSQSGFQISHIENFTGNLGEKNNFKGGQIEMKENFWGKFFWYVIVALLVVISGNVISHLIIKLI